MESYRAGADMGTYGAAGGQPNMKKKTHLLGNCVAWILVINTDYGDSLTRFSPLGLEEQIGSILYVPKSFI